MITNIKHAISLIKRRSFKVKRDLLYMLYEGAKYEGILMVDGSDEYNKKYKNILKNINYELSRGRNE